MPVDFGAINYLAVLAGGLVNMVTGALWYSPILFLNHWISAVGLSQEDITRRGA